MIGVADVTDEFFAGAHGGADHAFTSKIRESAGNAGDDGKGE